MDINQNFVGTVKVKPVLQEIVKTSAGGMIAVSSAILFFWMHADKEITPNIFVMLCTHVFAIPLLAAARIFYAVLDGYERISAQADSHSTNLIAFGVSFALVGYFMQIFYFSKILSIFFSLGMVVACYQIWRFSKRADDPHMIRR